MKLTTALLSTVLLTSAVFSASIATAQPGLDSSYLGIGVSAGATNGGRNNDYSRVGGNLQGRLAIPSASISLRGTLLFGNETVAVMPVLSYDIPVAQNTNLYLGAGYSFIGREGKNTSLGNRNAPVITLGAESAVSKNVVVYGDLKWGIDAYKGSSADAVSFQVGVGYRF